MSMNEIIVLILLGAILMQMYVLDERVKRLVAKFNDFNDESFKCYKSLSNDLSLVRQFLAKDLACYDCEKKTDL